jgi:hypothetical protein
VVVVVVVAEGGAVVVVVDGLGGGGDGGLAASRVEQASDGCCGSVTGTVPETGTTNRSVVVVSRIASPRPPKYARCPSGSSAIAPADRGDG